MMLAQLLSQLESPHTLTLPDTKVTGVAQDSRQVKAGYIFVARRGEVVDGHRFIPNAIAQGAVAIVGTGMPETTTRVDELSVPYITVPDDKIALAQLAAAFHEHPSRRLHTIGVTGTDGKTTTSTMLHHLLNQQHVTGLLSTAGIKIGTEPLATHEPTHGHFTTPEATEVQRYLAQFVEAGAHYAIVESSSHGFAMHRLDGIDYAMGIITNLSPEHLDYHGTLESYRDAKAELVRRAALSIINVDDAHADYFRAQAKGHVITYGIHNEAMWQAIPKASPHAQGDGLHFKVKVALESSPQSSTEDKPSTEDKSSTEYYEAFLPMLGTYNIYNALAAMAAVHQCGVSIPTILESLRTFTGVAGRMQRVSHTPCSVLVDFAHTPDALRKAIQAVRPQTTGNIIVVIGAAGERDPSKRAPLGKIAIEEADYAVFTEEDSRSEGVQSILESIVTGARDAGGIEEKHFWRIADRRAAIRFAVALAQTGDVVLLCGKGHETTLERADAVLPWNEVDEAHTALRALDT